MTKLNDLVAVNDETSFVCTQAAPAGYPKLIQFVVICLDGEGKVKWSRWFFSEELAVTAMERAIQLEMKGV